MPTRLDIPYSSLRVLVTRRVPLRVKLRSHGAAMARPVYLQQRTYSMRAGTAVECQELTWRYGRRVP
jgi:hypothetical protein